MRKFSSANESSSATSPNDNGGSTSEPQNNSSGSSNPFAASADMFRQYQKNGTVPAFGNTAATTNKNTMSAGEINNTTSSWSLQAQELVQHMDEFVAIQSDEAVKEGTSSAKLDDAMADKQLLVARQLRQLLDSNQELLHLAQERNWIPLLLGWLNLHDRPAVQVEALLTLTAISELCAQLSYYSQGVKGDGSKPPPMYFPSGNSGYSSAASSSSSGGVPYPPLSFSKTMSPEAMAAFDASLSFSINETKGDKKMPASSLSCVVDSPLGTPVGGTTTLSNNPLIPPPTSAGIGDGSSFPRQLSASSQQLLVHHDDAVPTLIELLASPQREVYEQSMWILGSIAAGDATANMCGTLDGRDKQKKIPARDVVMAAGIITPILDCLTDHKTNLSLQRMGSWTLSNLIEGIFQQSPGKGSRNVRFASSECIDMVELLPVLRHLLGTADAEVLSYTCWTLSHLCDGPSSHLSAIVTAKDKKAPRGGLVPRLVELLLHPSWRVTKPALRTIGNIVCAECSDDEKHSSSSSTDYTEIILACGAVPRLKELVVHSNREIQKEACWTLSNIAAGTVDQIQAVLDSGAIPPLVKLVSDKKTDQEVRSEACWVVLNATSCGSNAQIEVLVDEGCVEVLGVLLGEQSMVMMALEGLERVLQVEEVREDERRATMEKGNPDPFPSRTLVSSSLIEKGLDKRNSTAVTKRANRIWKQHFVSCALCNESFSKHRTADAKFCDECKCYVCSKCDCRVYHLSYQEELWAESEQKPEAKKSKNKKKKKKKKGASKPQPLISPDDPPSPNKEGSIARSLMSSVGRESNKSPDQPQDAKPAPDHKLMSASDRNRKSGRNEDKEVLERVGQESPQEGEQIDFVLYLQQTGSIIALAKLMDAMDALDYGDESAYDAAEFDDTELEMLRHHKMVLNQQQATN